MTPALNGNLPFTAYFQLKIGVPHKTGSTVLSFIQCLKTKEKENTEQLHFKD